MKKPMCESVKINSTLRSTLLVDLVNTSNLLLWDVLMLVCTVDSKTFWLVVVSTGKLVMFMHAMQRSFMSIMVQNSNNTIDSLGEYNINVFSYICYKTEK